MNVALSGDDSVIGWAEYIIELAVDSYSLPALFGVAPGWNG